MPSLYPRVDDPEAISKRGSRFARISGGTRDKSGSKEAFFGSMCVSYFKIVIVLLAVETILTTTSERHKRQLLGYSDLVLQEKIDSTPADPKTKGKLCWERTSNFIRINPLEYAQRQEQVFRLLSTICSDLCLPSIADLVNACFQTYQEHLSLACGSNGQIQCWQLPRNNTGESVATACYEHNETAACPEDCKDELMNLVELGGCCVNNVFNTSIFGPQLEEFSVADNMLWETCDMDRVSFCPTPQALDAAAAPTYITTNGAGPTNITTNDAGPTYITTSGCVDPSIRFSWFILLSFLLHALF